ncbi:PRC1 regulator, partial [Spizella passerina]|nr:PRC1 regulator [Spizella passerina]
AVPSEVLASEAVSCLNRALAALRDIWEEIGIPEEQRLERTDVVRKHIKSLLDMMVAEEESLKERLLKSIALCRKELDTLCRELQLGPFEVRRGILGSAWVSQEARAQKANIYTELLFWMLGTAEGFVAPHRPGFGRWLCGALQHLVWHVAGVHAPSWGTSHSRPGLVAAVFEQRREEFVSNKRQIVLLMEELDHTPDTSFERDVVCEDEEAFCLSEDNIMALQNLLQQVRS